jgi:hypothetical protein
MKWWNRVRELRHNRWLPFYLPIIGTLLYIALVLLLVPTDFDQKDTETADSETAASASSGPPAHPSALPRARRAPKLVSSAAAPAMPTP